MGALAMSGTFAIVIPLATLTQCRARGQQLSTRRFHHDGLGGSEAPRQWIFPGPSEIRATPEPGAGTDEISHLGTTSGRSGAGGGERDVRKHCRVQEVVEPGEEGGDEDFGYVGTRRGRSRTGRTRSAKAGKVLTTNILSPVGAIWRGKAAAGSGAGAPGMHDRGRDLCVPCMCTPCSRVSVESGGVAVYCRAQAIWVWKWSRSIVRSTQRAWAGPHRNGAATTTFAAHAGFVDEVESPRSMDVAGACRRRERRAADCCEGRCWTYQIASEGVLAVGQKQGNGNIV